MSTKSSLSFKPAPRPQPRITPEEARRLQEETRDLGFGRPTAAPSATPAEQPADAPTPTEARAPVDTRKPVDPPEPEAAAPAARAKAPPAPASKPGPDARGPALKFDVPDALWTELRQEALNRRVTVRYLVLEALAAKGYQVDLDAIPEDGRRLR